MKKEYAVIKEYYLPPHSFYTWRGFSSKVCNFIGSIVLTLLLMLRSSFLYRHFLWLAVIVSALFLFSFVQDMSVLERILKKMVTYNSARPQEKLYLHLDKPFYAAGEDVWFKAYLVEAVFHVPDSASRVVYVELIDASQTILQRKILYSPRGATFGDLQLPDTLREGKYLLRAYTNYMKNTGEDFFFQREISVLNPARSARGEEAKALDPDSIDFQFFPEGGNLVACGAPNRIAFKALGPDGKSLAVEGEILDEKNAVVMTFNTQHKGMGLIKLKPESGKKYVARITKPYAVNRLFRLPRVLDKGYIMQVDETGRNIKVVVFTNEDKPASGTLPINIVVQSRGKVYHAQQGQITSNAFFTYIPRSKFPDGISQITLFDSEGRPVAERLIHQNQQEHINIALVTSDSVLGKRKQVTLFIDALYKNGAPAAGSFSLTVYDEGVMQSQEKYPMTINNYLTLTSDLRGRIEDPGYYLKDSLPETKKNLDLLMMVHGWRRFTWKEVLSEQLEAQKFNHEKGLPISGKVLKMFGKRPPASSNLKIMSMRGNSVFVKPDSSGVFYSDGLLYYDTMDLVIQTENEKGKKQPHKVLLDPFNPAPPSSYTATAFEPFDAARYLKQQTEQKAISQAGKVNVLKEIEISEERERDSRTVVSQAERVIDVSKLSSGYMTVFEMIQSRVPGVIVTGSDVKMRGQTAAFMVDGMQTTNEMVGMISPTDVERIEIHRGGGMIGAAAAINVVLRKGAMDRAPIGVNQVTYPGFYQGREFYSPQFDVPDDRHNLPDRRTTLYWEPMIETDNTGKFAVSFFTADQTSRYRIVIEGITLDGYPGSATKTFLVKEHF